MSRRKEVLLSTHQYLDSGWADVYLTFKLRPGRRVRWGPCLVTRATLLGDLEQVQQCCELYPGEEHEAHKAQLTAILAGVDEYGIYADSVEIDPKGERIPNLYSPAEVIDRPEAERMVRWLLRHLGVRDPKLRWLPLRLKVRAL